MNVNFNPFPELSTKRLRLRRLNRNDLNALQQLRSDDSVNKYLDRPKSITIEECEAHVKKIDNNLANNQSGYWVLTLKNDDMLIGAIGLWNFQPKKDLAEIGYELSPAHQGKGLMQEAVEKIIEYGFYEMGLKVITGIMDAGNERSARLLEHNNFIKDLNYTYVSKEDAGDEVIYFLKKIEK